MGVLCDMDMPIKYLEMFWGLLTTPFIELKGSPISAAMVLLTLVSLYVVYKASYLLESLVKKAITSKSIDHGLKVAIGKFTRYTSMTVGVIVTLETAGISLSSLAAIGAVLMVGIGFGLQNITQNFISGIIILLERPIKIGDWVEVGDITGIVTEIGARSTVVQTRDELSIIVPNSQFISEQVVNQSHIGDFMRQHVRVGVAYGSPVELVKKILLKVAYQHSEVLRDPAPFVMFENFGDSALEFDLRVFVKNFKTMEMTLSDLRFAIDKEFRDEGITIPFPQRVLHFPSTSPEQGKLKADLAQQSGAQVPLSSQEPAKI